MAAEAVAIDYTALAAAMMPGVQYCIRQTVTHAVAEGLKGVEAKVDSFATRAGRLERAGASVGSTMAPSPGGGGSPPPFVPRSIIIKGFCEWTKRREEGLAHLQADEFVAAVLAHLPDPVKATIGKPAYRGMALSNRLADQRRMGRVPECKGLFLGLYRGPQPSTQRLDSVVIEKSAEQKQDSFCWDNCTTD
eukprot:3509033-Lingulodinium_polyedra.AAC.1